MKFVLSISIFTLALAAQAGVRPVEYSITPVLTQKLKEANSCTLEIGSSFTSMLGPTNYVAVTCDGNSVLVRTGSDGSGERGRNTQMYVVSMHSDIEKLLLNPSVGGMIKHGTPDQKNDYSYSNSQVFRKP